MWNVYRGTSRSWKAWRASCSYVEPRCKRPGTAMPADRSWSETNHAGDHRWTIKSLVASVLLVVAADRMGWQSIKLRITESQVELFIMTRLFTKVFLEKNNKVKSRRISWKIGVLSHQFYTQRSVFISHQRESKVFIKFCNHAQKPYFLHLPLWLVANRCLELTLVKEVRSATISLRRHFDILSLLFIWIFD